MATVSSTTSCTSAAAAAGGLTQSSVIGRPVSTGTDPLAVTSLAATFTYTASLNDIGFVPQRDVDVVILRATPTDYCIRGQHVGSGQTFYGTPVEGLTSTPCG